MQGPLLFAAGLALGALGGASAALADVSLVWAWRGAEEEELRGCRELFAAMGKLVE